MQAHRIPAGHYTDDTAMALCLGDSLLACGGYNSYDVMSRYLRWASAGYRSSTGLPADDIGTQTVRAIEQFADRPVITRDQPRTDSAGNGGIMRLAPAVIASGTQPISEVLRLCRISSRETHYSHEADAGAEIFGAMLHGALHEYDKIDVVDVKKHSTGTSYDEVYTRIAQIDQSASPNDLSDRGGYVVDAIKIARWAFLCFDSFAQGMTEVIRLGGDTDTNACIYGQLAGAYYGYEAIPRIWRDELAHEADIRQLAGELYQKQSSAIIATRFEEDTSQGWFVPYEH